MEQSQLPTPHDNFLQFVLSIPAVAQELFELLFSPADLARLKIQNGKLESDSFIDSDLRNKQADLLFSFEYHDPTGESATEESARSKTLTTSIVSLPASAEKPTLKRAYIYFLAEHKSKLDKWTVLQMLGYQLRIWERLKRRGEPLGPIIPVLIYHGEREWQLPTRMEELVPYPLGFEPYQLNYGVRLLDLSQFNEREFETDLAKFPILQNTFELLKYIRHPRLIDRLESILAGLANCGELLDIGLWVHTIGVYVMAVNKEIGQAEFGNIVTSVFPTQIEPGSLADRLLKQGREEGIEKGIEKGKLVGKVQTLQELLSVPVNSDGELREQSVDELMVLVDDLQQQLRKRDR
jgi:predicted transposase YdaD